MPDGNGPPAVKGEGSAATPRLDSLSVERCWELVGRGGVGRIALAVDGEAPVVVPVNYRVEDRMVVFRTRHGTRLAASGQHPVAFQVDAVDWFHRSGWSVLIRGVASVERCGSDDAPVPWPGAAGRTVLVRLWPRQVTGRRLSAGELVWDRGGYL